MRENKIFAERDDLDVTRVRLPFAARVKVSDEEVEPLAALCSGFGTIGESWNWNWLDPKTARFYFQDEETRDSFFSVAWLGLPPSSDTD